MAFREVRVFEVREVLHLWLAGDPGGRTAGRLGPHDRPPLRRRRGRAGLARNGGAEQLSDEFLGRVGGLKSTEPGMAFPGLEVVPAMADLTPRSEDDQGDATQTGPAVPPGVGPPNDDRLPDEADDLQLGGELSFPVSDPPAATAPTTNLGPTEA